MYVVYEFKLPNDMFYIGVASNLNNRISCHWSESRTHGRKIYSNLEKIKQINEQSLSLADFSKMFSLLFAGTKEEAYMWESMWINDSISHPDSLNIQNPKIISEIG